LSTIARWAKPTAGASPVATNGSDRRSAATVGDLNSERSRGGTLVFIHGAGDAGWYWHLVEAELRKRGHDTVSPDLPCDDDSAGLPEYADTVVDAIGDRTNLIVVAQSLGAFTAPLVCDRVAVQLLVLIAPMIPAPGEAPADYWTHTKYARRCASGTTTISPSSTRTSRRNWPPRHSSEGAPSPKPGWANRHRSRPGPTSNTGPDLP
jgi:pimeloyl-ACP methyl ester carboxylesterase